jgi:hypothetical protein
MQNDRSLNTVMNSKGENFCARCWRYQQQQNLQA